MPLENPSFTWFADEESCSIQVADDFGRTPLHDACWTADPCFRSVEKLLDLDLRLLFVVDCRGYTPLAYVKRDHWNKWIDFFKSKSEIYWAPRDISVHGEEAPPKLVGEARHSRPIPDPLNAASIEDAKRIASGSVDLDEILNSRREQVAGRETTHHQ
eukprot:CAMPEP_0118719308 /NCGR_PEP_ID=MMETSP0800-20121206/29397_1 /TAXON_ID=210618 ORGANISM="Striatella unipunctata, Strain CCMP2910" /NCGR_SAMPLE_ID=MMETSP0800 /ASSEMBLY_ACC=CAM_ASM_000638 /LENGTH=157 /DNA_ID=CAMNT_0006626651 /DNA_START=188 /DNA_END=661 /DNA_ORIENTATION=+